jgi:hypothetical protein
MVGQAAVARGGCQCLWLLVLLGGSPPQPLPTRHVAVTDCCRLLPLLLLLLLLLVAA